MRNTEKEVEVLKELNAEKDKNVKAARAAKEATKGKNTKTSKNLGSELGLGLELELRSSSPCIIPNKYYYSKLPKLTNKLQAKLSRENRYQRCREYGYQSSNEICIFYQSRSLFKFNNDIKLNSIDAEPNPYTGTQPTNAPQLLLPPKQPGNSALNI